MRDLIDKVAHRNLALPAHVLSVALGIETSDRMRTTTSLITPTFPVTLIPFPMNATASSLGTVKTVSAKRPPMILKDAQTLPDRHEPGGAKDALVDLLPCPLD